MPKRRRVHRLSPFQLVGDGLFLVVDTKKRGSFDLTREMAARFARAIIAGSSIILVAPVGAEFSDKLRLVVDAVEYYDATDPESALAATQRALLIAANAPPS